MDTIFKKHIKRLPLYTFVLGVLVLIFYVVNVWDAQNSPGRSLAVFLMIPFYFGCVVLSSLLVWLCVQIFNRFFQKD